jgi:hypothetical protein
LNSGLCTCKVEALLLEPHFQVCFFSGYFGGGGLVNYLPGPALNLYPPNLSLSNSQDYGLEWALDSRGDFSPDERVPWDKSFHLSLP